MMKIAVILLVVGVMVGALAATAPAAETSQAFLWNGVHWQQVSIEGKAGYIFGVGNMANYEVAAARGRKVACVSQVLMEEMKKKTVMEIIAGVDKYYQDNPGKVDALVIDVILGQLIKISPGEVAPGTTKK
jgi:hypothetical protein